MLTERPVEGPADLAAIAALARSQPPGGVVTVDLAYRLTSWALDDPANTRLWFDESGALVGYAILQLPFWTIDYANAPGYPDLPARMLAWADERARELARFPHRRGWWHLPVPAGDVERLRVAEAAGFRFRTDESLGPWRQLLLRRESAWPPDGVETPFTIRPLAGAAEVAGYVACHRAAFETRNMTVEWRLRTLAHPEYVADLDLVAVTEGGLIVAFCVGWLERRGSAVAGQIEPMGVHPDFRRAGLGRAILGEALRRFHNAGAHSVYVETNATSDPAQALYEAVGFRALVELPMYRKGYDTE